MFKEYTKKIIIVIMLMLLSIGMEVKAEINFDFALPLFKQNEVNFEKTKPTDYNFQLLKKYILEHDGNVLAQYHAIVRWFSLIKLSDTPRHDELINVGNKYFSTVGKKNPTTEERLREIFYKGVLLSIDKTEDPESKKDQEFEDILLNNEEELHENPDYWIAKGILFQVLKNRPTNYFNMMKPEEDLKIALTLIPRTAHYYYVIGQCFRFLGKADSALFLSIASYEKAASLDPRNQKLQNSLLGIYMGLHEEYQAQDKHEPFWLEEAVYKKILEMSPSNPHALNNLGYLYAEYGVNTKSAEELCLKAVELAPENAGFYDSLGWAAFKNKDYQLAKDSLQKSISLRNNVYDSHYHLATVYYTNMEYDEAAKQYQEAIELKPDSAEALNNLANQNHKLIIILNDNGMSISKPTGAISRMFAKISSAAGYNRIKVKYKSALSKNKFGRFIYKISRKFKNGVKRIFVQNTIFSSFDLSYVGPVDGHNIKDIEKALKRAKNTTKSVVVHVCTQKGKGYESESKYYNAGI